MKALTYISLITVLILTSCTQSLYTGAEIDDLYYRPSDQVVVIAENREIPQEEEAIYYDEVYAADTLVADFYYDSDPNEGAALRYDDASSVDPFVYYDDYSYASRINRFHGNYLYPYWRDSWYNPYLYAGPSLYMGYGFGYRPHHYSMYGHYDPFFYDPFYYSAIHSSYYYGYYPSYYSRYSYYSPYSYGYGTGYLSGYGMPIYGGSSGRDYTATVARRQTYSTVSDRYLAGTGTSRTASATTNRIATGSRRTGEATSVTGIAGSESRRTATTIADPTQKGAYQTETRAAQVADVSRRSTQSTAVVSRPTYVSTDRSYTPTYNNPRITTRPSYNTSRANATTIIPSGNNTRTNRTVSTNVRTQTSISTNPVRRGATGTSIINRTINSVIPSMGTRSTTTGRVSTGTSVSTGRTTSGTSSVSTGRTSTSKSSGSTGRTSTSTSRTTGTGRTGGR